MLSDETQRRRMEKGIEVENKSTCKESFDLVIEELLSGFRKGKT